MLYAASGGAIFALGFIGTFDDGARGVRRILAVNVMSSGVFLLFVASARRAAVGPPDPIPHALVLTGIVVSVSATALALALAKRLARLTQDSDEPER
jgi:multicomponent Na+:H+ antiporter subunit C